MTTSRDILRTRKGAVLTLRDDGEWCVRARDGSEELARRRPAAAWQFFEEIPSEALLRDAHAVSPFPMRDVFGAAVAARAEYWVERALGWMLMMPWIADGCEGALRSALGAAWESQTLRETLARVLGPYQRPHLLKLLDTSTSVSARELAAGLRDGRVEASDLTIGSLTARDAVRVFSLRCQHHRAAGMQNNAADALPALATRSVDEHLALITLSSKGKLYTVFTTDDLGELVTVLEADRNPNSPRPDPTGSGRSP